MFHRERLGTRKRRARRPWLLLASAGVLAAGLPVLGSGASGTDEGSLLVRGRDLYAANCAACHGEGGDGRGPAARMLAAPPRDFRPGIFKFRSTPHGTLPTDADLLWTIAHGMRWTGMVGRPDLPEGDRRALVAFVKSFSPRFATESPAKPIPIPPAPPTTSALVREGKREYVGAGCAACHGPAGRGDGPAARGMHDAWGNPTRPSDLTWRPLKRGSEPVQIYRTIVTGLDGSPMPGFGGTLEPHQVWALVAFLDTLVPPDHRLPPSAVLGEERTGWMIVRMGGMMMRGMGGMMGRGMGGMGMMRGPRGR